MNLRSVKSEWYNDSTLNSIAIPISIHLSNCAQKAWRSRIYPDLLFLIISYMVDQHRRNDQEQRQIEVERLGPF